LNKILSLKYKTLRSRRIRNGTQITIILKKKTLLQLDPEEDERRQTLYSFDSHVVKIPGVDEPEVYKAALWKHFVRSNQPNFKPERQKQQVSIKLI